MPIIPAVKTTGIIRSEKVGMMSNRRGGMMTKLDRYALKLAAKGHRWTAVERRLYELATRKAQR